MESNSVAKAMDVANIVLVEQAGRAMVGCHMASLENTIGDIDIMKVHARFALSASSILSNDQTIEPFSGRLSGTRGWSSRVSNAVAWI